jgi:hypothetical protein
MDPAICSIVTGAYHAINLVKEYDRRAGCPGSARNEEKIINIRGKSL